MGFQGVEPGRSILGQKENEEGNERNRICRGEREGKKRQKRTEGGDADKLMLLRRCWGDKKEDIWGTAVSRGWVNSIIARNILGKR